MIDKILDRLEKEYVADVKDNNDVCNNRAIYKAIDIVKQVATEHNNGWIKCSDRLPPEGELVTVCFKHGNMVTGYRKWGKEEKEILWYDNNYDDELNEKNIIAWMPLPEPYKED